MNIYVYYIMNMIIAYAIASKGVAMLHTETHPTFTIVAKSEARGIGHAKIIERAWLARWPPDPAAPRSTHATTNAPRVEV